ncbi:MAG: hypothetical protein AAF639_19130 [Chloroflexota bacterium]
MINLLRRLSTLPHIKIGVDRGDLEWAIRHAFYEEVGEEEVIDVYISRYPEEYGATVLLKNEPTPEAEEFAFEQEDYFRSLGIRVGILIFKMQEPVYAQ